jgi:integrase
MHDAGLRVKRGERCGIHSLRHTLGSLMLEKETPLPVISQILGHRSIQSTETYLRINMSGLAECPIDPEKVFDHEI